jgi:16S rRNA (cytosine967-C5)-methyltransferase
MKQAAPARRAAYAALRAVTSNRHDLPDALARVRTGLADERDAALAAEITTGTLRWMGALDAVVEAFGHRPLPRIDPEVLDILRLGAYQLLHLDRVPARAVVDDAVEMTRGAHKGSASSFVNAVLRRIARERERLPLPAWPDAPDREAAIAYLSVTCSHPRWLVERWLEREGFDRAEAWVRFDNSVAPLTLRANTLTIARDELAARLAAAGVTVSPTRFSPDGLVVGGGNPLSTPLHEQGAFFVQDEASQLVALVAGARPGERVLDACASPGGKTVAMAGRMGDRGLLVAGDVRARRMDLLERTIARSGARSVRLVRLDAEALPFGPVFDRVLVDAPCSGLGTLRRDPEIRWRRTNRDLPALAATQRRILERAATAVKPGGRLVYSTCSSEPEENEDVVRGFLLDHDEFEIEPPREADTGVAGLAAMLTPEGFFRTTPPAHGLEAFFAATLRRHRELVNPKYL